MGYASAMAWVLVLVVGVITVLFFRTSQGLGPLQRGDVAMTTTELPEPDRAAPGRPRPAAPTPSCVAGPRTVTAAAALLFHLFVLAVIAVVLYPGVWMLMSSFKPTGDIVGNVSLWPETRTLANYATALSGIGGVSFWTFFCNSMILAVGSVVGIMLSASVTAYAFARIEFPGRKVFFALMIATLLLPFHVVIIPQYIMFNNLGLVDTFMPLLHRQVPRSRSILRVPHGPVHARTCRASWTRPRGSTAPGTCGSSRRSCCR